MVVAIVGYTPAGVECWNGIRAIDYLSSRGDVDPARIGVTGISGGGAATLWIAAADSRVACAVPISGMSDLECYVGDKVIDRHCDCMLMVNNRGWAWTTIAALVAPRPLLFANSDQDPYFPMDANRRIVERLRELYAMAEVPGKLAEYTSHGGHADRADLREATYRWMNAHLKGDSGPVQIVDPPKIEEKQLRVFPEDRDVPADALNGTIDETFVAIPHFAAPSRRPALRTGNGRGGRPSERCRSMRFPRSFPLLVPSRRTWPRGALRWLATEPGIEVAVLDLRMRAAGAPWCTLIVLNEDEPLTGVPGWAQPLLAGGSAVVLAPRGVGPTRWNRGKPAQLRRASACADRTVGRGGSGLGRDGDGGLDRDRVTFIVPPSTGRQRPSRDRGGVCGDSRRRGG